MIDRSGQIYGTWKVIERDRNPKSKSHETFWKCECQRCGNIASVRKTDLDRKPKSCNKCKGWELRSFKIGDRYGYLTIVGVAKPHGNKTYVTCQCDCGKIVDVYLEHLKGHNHSRTISCGCATMSAGELTIKRILDNNDVIYEQQYIISDFSQFAPFDFAIFDEQHNLLKLIEFDGEQHYHPVEHFGGQEKYDRQVEVDSRKNKYCQEHNIKLQRIPYYDIDRITIDMLMS